MCDLLAPRHGIFWRRTRSRGFDDLPKMSVRVARNFFATAAQMKLYFGCFCLRGQHTYMLSQIVPHCWWQNLQARIPWYSYGVHPQQRITQMDQLDVTSQHLLQKDLKDPGYLNSWAASEQRNCISCRFWHLRRLCGDNLSFLQFKDCSSQSWESERYFRKIDFSSDLERLLASISFSNADIDSWKHAWTITCHR